MYLQSYTLRSLVQKRVCKFWNYFRKRYNENDLNPRLRRFGYGFFCDGGLRSQRGQAQHSKGSILHCRGEAEILCVSSEEAENLCEKLYAPRLSSDLKLRRYQRRSAGDTCRRSVAMSVYDGGLNGSTQHFILEGQDGV